MKRKGLILCFSLVLLWATTIADAQAQCTYFNPLLLPFAVAGAVAGAVVGTAAAITTAVVPVPVYPAYSGPAYYAPVPRYYGPVPYHSRPVWMRGHYNRYGYWVPGHWR